MAIKKNGKTFRMTEVLNVARDETNKSVGVAHKQDCKP